MFLKKKKKKNQTNKQTKNLWQWFMGMRHMHKPMCIFLKFCVLFWLHFFEGQNLVIKLVVILSYNLNKINISTYFENLTVVLHVFYTLNTHIKFCINKILFIIWFIRLYFMHNFKLQKLTIWKFYKWHNYWFLIWKI